MSKEGRKILSTEERDRLNAALAMSALATGLSPVKVIQENLIAEKTAVSSTSCSDLDKPTLASVKTSYHNMEGTALKLTDCANSVNKRSQHFGDAQLEPLDLSSPQVADKIIRDSNVSHDSGNESNSPEPQLSSKINLTRNSPQKTIAALNTHLNPHLKSGIKPTTIIIQNVNNDMKFMPAPQNKQSISRPDNLSGLKPVALNYNSTNNSTNAKMGTVLQSPIKSDSELDSPSNNVTTTTFAQWTMPYKPLHSRPLSSDCQSYSSSTSGYSSESFSEAKSESEIESPGPERLRSSLPPKKRKHIRHARNWEVDTKKKSSPSPSTPSTSVTNEDDEVFTPTESPVKSELRLPRPNARTNSEKTKKKKVPTATLR